MGNLASEIRTRKVDTGQADRIVLNLDDTASLSLDDMRQQLTSYPIPGLQEVIGIKHGTAEEDARPGREQRAREERQRLARSAG